jgi:tetratricopeptide (TPR) repeat protein
MDEKQETTASSFTDCKKAEKLRACLKDGTTSSDSPFASTRARRHAIQNFRIIWLDVNIDESVKYSQNSINHLCRWVNTIDTFTDADECVDFLSEIKDDKVFMIVSNAFERNIVPMIHEMFQLNSIYVFLDDHTHYEQWPKEWWKVKGIFTQMTAICDAIQHATRRCHENSIPMTFMSTSDAVNPSLDQLDQSFMYTQLLKETLLEFDNNEARSIDELVAYCCDQYADNPNQLERIKRFEREYNPERSIWWYTYECFLYSMLNRSLRTLEVDIILKMGFFIRDLHEHIEKLHLEQSDDHQIRPSVVYRGQCLSKTDFGNLKRLSGGLMSFNNFLSTSTNREVSLAFADSDPNNADVVGILFKITIDRSISSTPFAFLDKISSFPSEEEVLFSTHTVFRICDIKQMHDTNERLWEVNLRLTTDNDEELSVLTGHLREEIFQSTNRYSRLGSLLIKLSQLDKAEQLYDTLLEQAPEEHDRKHYYFQLGKIKMYKGAYDEALSLGEKSFRIPPKSFPSDLPFNFLDNIGDVPDQTSDYSKILPFLQCLKELQPIIEKVCPSIDPMMPLSYSNMAVPHPAALDYSKVLGFYEDLPTLAERFLPHNDPLLASIYNNIAIMSWKMGDYSKALSSYEKELQTRLKYLLPNHPDLAVLYSGVANVCVHMGDYSEALLNYEKVLEIRHRALPPFHLDLASSYENIGVLYFKTGDYSKALSHCEKALEIRQKSLPSVHLDLASSYNNVGIVYENMGDFLKARSFYEKAHQMRQESLPPDHPDLASPCSNTGMNFNWDFTQL